MCTLHTVTSDQRSSLSLIQWEWLMLALLPAACGLQLIWALPEIQQTFCTSANIYATSTTSASNCHTMKIQHANLYLSITTQHVSKVLDADSISCRIYVCPQSNTPAAHHLQILRALQQLHVAARLPTVMYSNQKCHLGATGRHAWHNEKRLLAASMTTGHATLYWMRARKSCSPGSWGSTHRTASHTNTA